MNTFLPNDAPQGRLTSKPFPMRKAFIGFLLGGGGREDQSCINLVVGGKVVRTATGKDLEHLEPHAWDVTEFAGQEGRLEIVDEHSGLWGHINVDHIVFSDVDPQNLLKYSGAFARLARALPLVFTGVSKEKLAKPAKPILADATHFDPGGDAWMFDSHVRLEGLKTEENGIEVLARTPDGDPVLLQIAIGQATLILSLAPNMPWAWTHRLICYANGLDPDTVAFETTRAGHGTMALATPDKEAVALPNWTDSEELARAWLTGNLETAKKDAGPSPAGATLNGALSIPFRLRPGQERSASFVTTWHFPNVERHGHVGNHYCRVFKDAIDAARHTTTHLEDLTARTLLYHRTVYESNIPEEFIDAMTSQSLILRSPTCWRSAEGYFGGFEGAYGCCPLNCTHVWNYAHAHARLFPEIGRNMRISDFITYLHDSGETSYRQHGPHDAYADGHCASIQAALREHQLSPDDRFLRRIYPNVRKAMEWFIGRYDSREEGLTRTHQMNTYDSAVSGPNTFVGSQYLGALAASEALARAAGDTASANRWLDIRRRGSQAQDRLLWNGAYYIQLPEDKPAHDYNNGCHSDQLLGQWWAHQLGLGHIYPQERVRDACREIFRHNFKPDFTGLDQIPRRYVDDGDGGLYMCTWPKGDRPDPYTHYSIEAWTGIEYSTAGLMVSEGLFDEARTIVRTARSRYDGRPRKNQNSGGGVCGMGNPFQELECGKFYARAMSAWGLLVTSQGIVLDSPAGILGFKPKWQPHDHRSFFTLAEGWGLFAQTASDTQQSERIELRHGKATLHELVFEVPGDAQVSTHKVRVNDSEHPSALERLENGEIRIALQQPLSLKEGDVLEVDFTIAG